jgi:hypothetical protein
VASQLPGRFARAAQGKAAESADTGVVSVGFANAAGRRPSVTGAASQLRDMP